MTYDALFTPINIGSMQLANRIVMSPMTTDYGTLEQAPTDRLLAYLEARAKGGVGLITLEVCSVALDHRYQMKSLSLSEDSFIDQHRRITDMAHSHGVKIQPQITHPGPESLAPFFESKPGVGPSVCVNPGGMQSCRPLELDEIPAVIEQYAAAAVRAREAGYDGMELHAAHAYMLLGSFLSPLRNARQDEYGGKSPRARARLLIETLTAIRSAVGPDFPITVSLSGYERFPGGRAMNESQRLAQWLVEAGADAFRVSGGTTDRLVTSMIMSSDHPDGLNVTQAQAIRQVVDVPVMVVGRIHTPEYANQIIAEGQADLIGMGRPFLADPEWPRKAREGRAHQIRRCISCENCIDSMIDYQNLNCAVNAAMGREETHVITPAVTPQKVVVIGSGPAGLETARVAALRGHEVILLERQKRLGGAMLLAATVHSDNELFYQWLTAEVLDSSVDVRLGQEATPDLLKGLAADVIVVATGAEVHTPMLPGSDGRQVFSGAQLRRIVEGRAASGDFGMLPGILRLPARLFMNAVSGLLTPDLLRKMTRYWLPLGKRVAIVGADLAAIELAEFLCKRGRKVSVFDAQKRIAPEIGPKRLAEHMDRLDRLGVTINTETECVAIENGGLKYRTALGEERHIQTDSIVLAGEPKADTRLFDSVHDLAPEVHAIGDCTGLGLIRKATDEGMALACKL